MARPPIRTEENDKIFFTGLENGHAVEAACRAARYTPASVYRWRGADAEFAKRWAEAIVLAVDLLEEEADRRGRDGIEEPIFYQGREVGRRRRFADTLLLARMKALHPGQYRGAQPAAVRQEPVNVIVRDFALARAGHHIRTPNWHTDSSLNSLKTPAVVAQYCEKQMPRATQSPFAKVAEP